MKRQSTISRIYSTLLLCAGLGAFCLALVTGFRNVGRIDTQLSLLSPYSTLADWVNIHAQSGLRLRIPQPIFVRVAKDSLVSLDLAKCWLEDLFYDTDEYSKRVKEGKKLDTLSTNTSFSSASASDVSNRTKEGMKTTQDDSRKEDAALNGRDRQGEGGASLLYVVTFCSSVFGSEAGLSHCRAQMMTKCSIDVLNWFEKSPANDNGGDDVQKCLTDNFKQKEGFLQSFNKKMEVQESRGKGKTGQGKVFILGLVISSVVAITVAAVIFYRYILKTLRDTKLKELLEDIDKRTMSLDPDQYPELPDDIEESTDFVLDNSDIVEEDSLMYMDFFYSFISIFYEIWSAEEEIEELVIVNNNIDDSSYNYDEDVFVTADVIEEVEDEFYSWALEIEQIEELTDCPNSDFEDCLEARAIRSTHLVYIEPLIIYEVHLSDRNESEFEPEEPPAELFLDMSIQENLLENARVGITVMHQCDISITEDNVVVTGFTVDKDDPLKFVYWKKRLIDLREELKADALEKLKMSCPTLFGMGWFKENLPKDEETAENEMKKLQQENEELAKNVTTNMTRERQIGDDTFISL